MSDSPRNDAQMDGSSEILRGFLAQLQQAAGAPVTVLFQGESGTGKAVAARMLHAASPRAQGPLVTVDLAALSPTLLESTLFGHEKGAFTDARQARRGLFRQAEGGTLVLDDVDLLPLELQVKLLRVLQERVVEPLGAEAPVPVDVRVVATTHRDLRQAVEEGEFREDLYFRLAVVVLEVPALRSRREDLPQLVESLTRGVAKRLKLTPRPYLPGALERLRNHPWPGNVRELENAIERVQVLRKSPDGEVLPVSELELGFLEEACRGVAESLAQEALRHGLTVDAISQTMMERALEEQKGNVSAAARQVGLTRRAFDYRIARFEEPAAEAEGA